MGTLVTTDTAMLFFQRGGGKRDRTADLLHAMQALSQLSYTPYGKTTFYYIVAASTSASR